MGFAIARLWLNPSYALAKEADVTCNSSRRRILTGAQALLIVLGVATSRDAWAQAQRLWTVPEIGALPRDASGLLVRAGRDLITATYAHIGLNVPDPSKRYAG